MQFSVSALFVLASAVSVMATDPRPTGCVRCPESGGNLCQRQVMGVNGAPALEVRSADCSSALVITVTPEPVITTVTKTHTDVTAIPTYATMCKDSKEAYASACKCGGIVAPTVTAPVQTVTVTATVAETTCAAKVTDAPLRFARR